VCVRPSQAYSEYAWLVNNKAELQKAKKKKKSSPVKIFGLLLF
jgi:hypothetical protein